MTLLYLEVTKYVRGQFNGQFYHSGPFQGHPGVKLTIWSNIGGFRAPNSIQMFQSHCKKNHFSKILHFWVFLKANLATLRHFRAIRRGINYFRASLEPFYKELAFFSPFSGRKCTFKKTSFFGLGQVRLANTVH